MFVKVESAPRAGEASAANPQVDDATDFLSATASSHLALDSLADWSRRSIDLYAPTGHPRSFPLSPLGPSPSRAQLAAISRAVRPFNQAIEQLAGPLEALVGGSCINSHFQDGLQTTAALQSTRRPARGSVRSRRAQSVRHESSGLRPCYGSRIA